MNRLFMGTGRLRARKNHVGFLLVKKSRYPLPKEIRAGQFRISLQTVFRRVLSK